MKRILPLLFIALALVGCKKDKFNFKEADLVGVWFCTEWEGADEPDISFWVNQDHTCMLRFGKSEIHYLTWAINANKLVFSGDSAVPEFTLKQLDKKHLAWIVTYDDGAQVRASFANLSQVLLGKWKSESVSLGNADITMDAAGTSTWVKGDAEPEIIKWSLESAENFASPCIKWEGVNVDFADLFKVNSVTDNLISMYTSSSFLVTFTRQ